MTITTDKTKQPRGHRRSAKRKNIVVNARMLRIDAYGVVARAVEEGVAYGITRAWKHHDGDTMTEEQMRDRSQALIDAVMNDLCDVLRFSPDDEA